MKGAYWCHIPSSGPNPRQYFYVYYKKFSGLLFHRWKREIKHRNLRLQAPNQTRPFLMLMQWRQRRQRLAALLHVSPTSSVEQDGIAHAIDEHTHDRRDPGWSLTLPALIRMLVTSMFVHRDRAPQVWTCGFRPYLPIGERTVRCGTYLPVYR
jgi:hypothetical protein